MIILAGMGSCTLISTAVRALFSRIELRFCSVHSVVIFVRFERTLLFSIAGSALSPGGGTCPPAVIRPLHDPHFGLTVFNHQLADRAQFSHSFHGRVSRQLSRGRT